MTEISLEHAIRSRHSVRGFLPKPVPQEVLLRVFELAQWAPSGTNVQPWQVYVASGTTRDTMRTEFMSRVKANQPSQPDHPDRGRMGDPWRERRRNCARVLYNAMGIAWEDKPGRAQASFRNFEMFDAPHMAFLCINEAFGKQSAADVGMYAQTLMLAMTANGLASCAQGTMGHYPDLVRETFDISPEVNVLFGISFGYEDIDVPANNARTTRASLEENVVFLGN
ncbi:MAG TPA: nitroreductase [Gammaproteobacteria bacterium]|nr:nitroreductase [Gammaproteobacteria bacterium]HIL95592.1 nitroreductase [Pseudomonadales bacterium]